MAGRRYDPETELYFYRARMYNPTLGRFLQRDPAEYIDGVNLYQYVRGWPIMAVDPSGLEKIEEEYIENFGSLTPWGTHRMRWKVVWKVTECDVVMLSYEKTYAKAYGVEIVPLLRDIGCIICPLISGFGWDSKIVPVDEYKYTSDCENGKKITLVVEWQVQVQPKIFWLRTDWHTMTDRDQPSSRYTRMSTECGCCDE